MMLIPPSQHDNKSGGAKRAKRTRRGRAPVTEIAATSATLPAVADDATAIMSTLGQDEDARESTRAADAASAVDGTAWPATPLTDIEIVPGLVVALPEVADADATAWDTDETPGTGERDRGWFAGLTDAGLFAWLDTGDDDDQALADPAADAEPRTADQGAGSAIGGGAISAQSDGDGWDDLPPEDEPLDSGDEAEDDGVAWDDLDALRRRIEAVGLPPGIRKHAFEELQNVERAYNDSNYRLMTMRWLRDWVVRLPWSTRTTDQLDLARVVAQLDADHYGLRGPKDAVIDFVAASQRVARHRGKILLLVGPPGVGKTSLARSVARALGRHYARAALGGIRDEGDLRGYSRSYNTAFPGHLIRAMRAAGSVNPVLCLDEVDKLTPMNTLGCPDAVLLEALDPEQNRAFVDLYMQVPFDLSQVFFVCTANGTAGIAAPLLDRMEVVEVPGYTEDEKLHIAERYLMPRHLRRLGFKRGEVVFEREALRALIADYTYEAGVREANRAIERVLARLARRLALKEEATGQRHVIAAADLQGYLGARRLRWMGAGTHDEIGVATGLGWAEAGGVTMPVEVTILPGSGHVRLTGRLGEVLRESAEVALTYVRGRAEELGLAPDVFRTRDIHVHLPAAAVSKDGPSAGVAIATALVSALVGRAARCDVGMTGEMTPRGRVLPVGGVREKVVAAARAGLAMVLVPADNMAEVEALGDEYRGRVEVVPVTSMTDILRIALREENERTLDG